MRAPIKIFCPFDIDQDKFYALVGPTNDNGCAEWLGSRVKQGYGRFRNHGIELRANRVALSLKLGEILTEKDEACHTCDNPPCCEESHLFKGTAKSNLEDASRKGRLPARKYWTHCMRGHEFTEDNIYWYKPNKPGKPMRRQCRACTLLNQARRGEGK